MNVAVTGPGFVAAAAAVTELEFAVAVGVVVVTVVATVVVTVAVVAVVEGGVVAVVAVGVLEVVDDDVVEAVEVVGGSFAATVLFVARAFAAPNPATPNTNVVAVANHSRRRSPLPTSKLLSPAAS